MQAISGFASDGWHGLVALEEVVELRFLMEPVHCMFGPSWPVRVALVVHGVDAVLIKRETLQSHSF